MQQLRSGKRILLCASQPREDVRSMLALAGYEVRADDLAQADAAPLPSLDLILIDATHASDRALHLCHALQKRRGELFIPILVLAIDASPRARLANLFHGADGYVMHPFEPAELLAQVRTFQQLKERHDRLLAKSAEVDQINQKLQNVCHQIDLEMELARRLQQSFLPQSLPEFGHVRFAVHYRPCGRVGGDFYDAFRLDEHNVGFYIADAMGHGVPASLLTIFVKKGVKAKEINGKEYRLIQPEEVLEKLNHDLIEQALPDQPFVTMAYALFNFKDATMRFARSGHPYPIYLPREGPACLWRIEGKPLGVIEAKFPMQAHQLQLGDRVLFYTDGVDSASLAGKPRGIASFLAAIERFRSLPVGELIDRLAEELFLGTTPGDDLTLLGMEYA